MELHTQVMSALLGIVAVNELLKRLGMPHLRISTSATQPSSSESSDPLADTNEVSTLRRTDDSTSASNDYNDGLEERAGIEEEGGGDTSEVQEFPHGAMSHGVQLCKEETTVDVRQCHNVQVGSGTNIINNYIQGFKFHIGHVYAANYFFAYLKIVIQQNQRHVGLEDKIEMYMNEKKLTENNIKMAKKLYIFVPECGNCPKLMSDKDPNMKETGCIELQANRAGSSRPYKNTAWSFEKGHQVYHVLAEYASILQTLTELPGLDDEDRKSTTKNFSESLKIFISNTFEDDGFVVELLDINDASPMISDILEEKIENDL
ncbi:unnamed protein product [Owenia fusiformis]|uniref:STING ligand-binding domain-containing protein n=1 Tax=Owenia fusiformis TaxID=6347 RepID=A0A8S4PPU6_OWEFU|nr:unnamed protein product [Owenia fusiformis]